MRVLLTMLTLVLAAMAIPNASAGSPVQCTLGPTTPGGDTDCRAQVEDCEAHTHIYDKEDALNVYEASCHDCGVRIGGGPFVQCDLIGPASSPATPASAAPDLIRTHCWTAQDGSGCSTTVARTCTYHSGTMGEALLVGASCTTAVGSCDATVSPVQVPPASCDVPLAASTAGIGVPQVCQAGFAQTWCDFRVGPCDLRVTPWTAWGDRYVVADCRIGGGAGATCHTEVHTQAPADPEHWCAF